MRFKKAKSGLELEIESLIEVLKSLPPDGVEYEKIVRRIETLHKLMMEEKKHSELSKGDLVACLTNLVGIGLILNYEKCTTITSKALAFVRRRV